MDSKKIQKIGESDHPQRAATLRYKSVLLENQKKREAKARKLKRISIFKNKPIEYTRYLEFADYQDIKNEVAEILKLFGQGALRESSVGKLTRFVTNHLWINWDLYRLYMSPVELVNDRFERLFELQKVDVHSYIHSLIDKVNCDKNIDSIMDLDWISNSFFCSFYYGLYPQKVKREESINHDAYDTLKDLNTLLKTIHKNLRVLILGENTKTPEEIKREKLYRIALSQNSHLSKQISYNSAHSKNNIRYITPDIIEVSIMYRKEITRFIVDAQFIELVKSHKWRVICNQEGSYIYTRQERSHVLFSKMVTTYKEVDHINGILE